MSAYEDGYYRGHQDALDGSRNLCEGGLIFGLLSELSNDENQDDWEEGYRDGYEDG